MTDTQSINWKIFCVVVDEKVPFSVKIQSDATVDELKKAIKEKQKPKLDNFAASDLTLFKADLSDGADLEENANRLLATKPTPLMATDELSQILQPAPSKGKIHILVQPPTSTLIVRTQSEENEASDVLTPLRKTKVNITRKLVEKWSQPIPATNLHILRTWLQKPLAEEEKIPISQYRFDELCDTSESAPAESALSAEQLSTLFRVSADERAPRLLWEFEHTVYSAPPTDGTKNYFHQSWDNNISTILRLIFSRSDAMAIRNSNHGTSKGLERPDYGFLLDNNCVFRGEEKGSNPDGDPKQELVSKLVWTYDPLPYILGYHAVTTHVHYVAITSPPSKSEPLFDHNLKFKDERVANMLPYRGRPEFVPFDLQDGDVQMSIGATVVRKKFRHKDAVDRVLHLVEIYKLLERKQVPNVDTLQRFKIEGGYPHVYLSPVGIDRLPKSGLEAFDAVRCVLEALKVMHSSPDPVYHRDIRGPNIMKRYDGQGWFLIDWSDASTAPTRAVTHLNELEHSPRVRQDNHGAEVDMWGIGKYLEHLISRATCQIASPDAVKKIARRWMADHTTSAENALEEAARDLFIGPSV